MKPLLTDEDRAALPPLYATEGQGEAALVRVRLFAPGTYWEWFVVEFDGEELLWGLASGHDVEAGYFSLSELAATGYVARDAAWTARPLAEVFAALAAARRA